MGMRVRLGWFCGRRCCRRETIDELDAHGKYFVEMSER
jgi:hypothetical protein